MRVSTANQKLRVMFFRSAASKSWAEFGEDITKKMEEAAVDVVSINQSLLDGELIISVWYTEQYRWDDDASTSVRVDDRRLNQWLL